jgi:dihydroorotase
MLFGPEKTKENIVVRGARVVDPVAGIDALLDVRVDDGVIAALGTELDTNSHRVIEGEGLLLAPAFVDPHVHLRTPGREDEENIASGTAAAAAGGYCAILAMPKGQSGAELTEMGELAAAGAAGFTDDGMPVAAPGLMRRALQYGAVTGRRIALHCEETTLSRDGQMHEGAVSAELGFTGYPSVAESLMVERDLALAAYERQPLHLLHLSAWESVQALRRARAEGVEATGEVTPHHLCLTDEAIRSLDPNLKMNPPLRSGSDRTALIEGLKDGTITVIATDHAPHARHEKDVPFEAAPFGASLYTHLVDPGIIALETLLDRMSTGPARAYGLPEPRIAVGAHANLVLLDLNASYRITEEVFRSRSVNSWLLGEAVKGKVRATIAAGRLAYSA